MPSVVDVLQPWDTASKFFFRLCSFYFGLSSRAVPLVVWSPAFHAEGRVRSQFTPCVILWLTKQHWDRFFSPLFRFPQSVSFHQCCILIHPSSTDAVWDQQLPMSWNNTLIKLHSYPHIRTFHIPSQFSFNFSTFLVSFSPPRTISCIL
jgi:hypothetical protein